MLQAGARLCKTLGEEFLPYLGTVMPALLQSAQLKAEMEITDEGSGDEEEDDDGEVCRQCLFYIIELYTADVWEINTGLDSKLRMLVMRAHKR